MQTLVPVFESLPRVLYYHISGIAGARRRYDHTLCELAATEIICLQVTFECSLDPGLVVDGGPMSHEPSSPLNVTLELIL